MREGGGGTSVRKVEVGGGEIAYLYVQGVKEDFEDFS
jgi:hypothetical protein